MKTVGVIGLGVMGLGIAQIFAAAGHSVVATDGDAATRDAAIDRIHDALAPRVVAGKLDMAEMHDLLHHVTIVPDITHLASCDLVIEAIAEVLDAKKALFAALEQIVSETAVLATNTSSLSVTDIAAGLTHPGRVLGLHFFNPAPVMKLVELIYTAETTHAAQDLVRDVIERIGKTVIACADRPGFIVNRCARPYYGEALAMLEEGQSAAAIDAAMVAAGYRLGPFALMDLIGADINLAATEGLHAAMLGHPRYHVFDALRQQVANGDLGRKAGRGFVTPVTAKAPPRADDATPLRIEAVLANEAASLLHEGEVTETAIDTAMTLGMNFPHGPIAAARARGVPAILAELARLEAAAPPHLKGRYAASPALADLA